MNVVFEPSLLFIADEDWWDEEKRDAFLEHLLDHLQLIDEYDICQIWWTEQLQTILVGDPNMHPWFGSDQRNPLIVNIHQKFYQRLSYWDESPLLCSSTPALSAEYRNLNAQECLLKLVHALIEQEENFYFCVGLANQLKGGEGYSFSCNCHTNQLLPKVINRASEWLPLLDPVAQFFPTSIEDFDTNFPKALALVLRQNFPAKPYLFDFEFSKTFKKSVVSRTTFRQEILEAVVKKLIFTTDESRLGLKDEFIDNKKVWRFRVTQRPHSTRIQYTVEGKTINFLQYYGEGEHDDGL
jgi:hypothetical protein